MIFQQGLQFLSVIMMNKLTSKYLPESEGHQITLGLEDNIFLIEPDHMLHYTAFSERSSQSNQL